MVKIEPTIEGYANMARMFAQQIISDVKVARKPATQSILVSLIDTMRYLHSVDTTLYHKILSEID